MRISNDGRKRQNDIDFIARCRKASLEELAEMMANVSKPDAPPWKRVCILRAMARLNTRVDSVIPLRAVV